MSEIYWLTRLDTINVLCLIVTIFSAILCFIFGIFGWCEEIERLKIAAKTLVVPFVVALLGFIFIPTEKEMMMILGLGQTIDYIQENETIKELPDKCVEALDAWVESLTKEE